jgi:hypothetical protein
VRCRWNGGGGHALVVDETHSFLGSNYMCVCDPYDGELRIVPCTPGSTVKYDGNYSPISSGNFFGGNVRAYDKAVNNSGELFGGMVRRK